MTNESDKPQEKTAKCNKSTEPKPRGAPIKPVFDVENLFGSFKTLVGKGEDSKKLRQYQAQVFRGNVKMVGYAYGAVAGVAILAFVISRLVKKDSSKPGV